MRIAFHTMGCKVNQFDTAVMEDRMRKADHTVVSFEQAADVYVINTCSVTEKSDQESRRLIRTLKRRNPKAKVVVTGCYAQTHPEDLVKIQGIDLILGNREKLNLADYLGGCDKTDGPILNVAAQFSQTPLEQPMIRKFSGHTRVFLKIQDGCDYRCSFCLIPRARGSGRSLLPEKVVEQVAVLAEEGYQEMVLTGVNLGTYGRDFVPKQSLAGLLRLLLDHTGIPRIRLSSIEPKTVTPELIDVMLSSPRICRHFHIPLQSGDDRVLKKMKRHYTREYYQRLILSLAERFPKAGFGTDVMVGFPGETDAEYQNTYALLEALPMTYFHVFPYSRRPKTTAAEMKDRIPESQKEKRVDELRRLSDEKGRQFFKAHVGQELEVLIEKERDPSTGLLKGFSNNYIKVLLSGPDILMNRIWPVRITEVREKSVLADLCHHPPINLY